jgi:DNA-binding LytR/AlgR family response regulator
MTDFLMDKRILVVEDEFILASDLAHFLESRGAKIVGPASSVESALPLVEGQQLDGAVLDVNLGKERVYPVADALTARGVPIVFATGYDELLMQREYIAVPRCLKPINKDALVKALARAMSTCAAGSPG